MGNNFSLIKARCENGKTCRREGWNSDVECETFLKENPIDLIEYRNTLISAHFGTGNFPHYSKSALFEVTVI